MANRELEAHYGLLLGLVPPWTVAKVDLDIGEKKRLTLHVQYAASSKVPCPECGVMCAIRDHREERIWRHLNTMQFETLVKSKLPRSDCAEHGIKTINAPWAGPRSQFTLLFERLAIEVLIAARSISKACDILRISWDPAQRIQANRRQARTGTEESRQPRIRWNRREKLWPWA